MKLRALFGTMVVLSTLVVALAAPASVLAASCQSLTPDNDHVGNRFSNQKGVQGAIDPPEGSNMDHCSGIPVPSWDAVSAWVSIEPGYGNPQYGNSNAIGQIGIIRCQSPYGIGACAGSGFRYFYAVGGCGTFEVPAPINIAVADTASHTYSIYKNSSTGNWHFRIDAGATGEIVISEGEASWTCWINDGPTEVTWFGETVDGGDHYSEGQTKLLFRNSKVQTNVGGPWSTVSFGADCDVVDDSNVYDHTCNVLDATPDRFEIRSYLN